MIMSIDPGTKGTGIAWFDSSKRLSTSVILANQNLLGKKILLDMARTIVNNIFSINPEILVFEDYGYGGGFFNVEVAELIGMIFCLLEGKKYQFVFLAPNTVKKIIAGNGRAKKQQVRKAVVALYGEKYGTVHESDAIAILHTFKLYQTGELTDKDAIRKIKGRMFYV